ncbi:MAG TPA: hypothetical protein VGV65_13280 [Nocardioides sp.]|nr:hypothetical protein [Nocardioides sp.]
MLDIGLLELLLSFVPILAMASILYWIIRLAVRHGVRDSRRPSSAERAAEVSEALRRHERP